MRFRNVFIVLALVLLWISSAAAATHYSPTCSQSDVQAAIDKAATGDVIILPQGSCTWATTVTVPSTKTLTLAGAGMDKTIIIKSPAGGDILNLSQSGSRVTGLQFNDGTVLFAGDVWRIDHCKFIKISTGTTGVSVRGNREQLHPTGLVDNCVFQNSSILVAGWIGLMSNALWAQPLNLGSGDNVVYIEDNSFTHTVFGHAVDANYGGRYVFRYNTLNDVYIEAHSVQSSNNRGAQKWEIYNNTINQINRVMWTPFFLRAGTGVVFNNTLTGTWTLPAITVDNVRSYDATRTLDQGWCNGNSKWDGNQPNLQGYPCRDQIGRSTDQGPWTDWKTGATGPPQQLVPAYAWNNKYGTQKFGFITKRDARNPIHIVEGRDFVNNTVKPGYVPYTYPHPRRGETAITPAPAPAPETTTVTSPTTTTTTSPAPAPAPAPAPVPAPAPTAPLIRR
jgi:hypothetical protein